MRFHFESLIFSTINKKSSRAIQRPVRFAGVGALTLASSGLKPPFRLASFF